MDPLAEEFPELTTYQYAGNTPIWAVDIDGLEPSFSTHNIFHGTPAFGDLAKEEQNRQLKEAGKALVSSTAIAVTAVTPGPEDVILGGIAATKYGGAILKAANKIGDEIYGAISSLFKSGDKGAEAVVKTEKVFTATDGPVDLNQQPGGVEGSSGSFGGTYVTKLDITQPDNLVEHMDIVPPKWEESHIILTE